MKPITVLLADDNKQVRTELRRLLELEEDLDILGEARDGRQAVKLVESIRPSVVVMDVSMPLLNGLQATRIIVKSVPATKVLMLSSYADETYILEAIKWGAMGYLLKHYSFEKLGEAIREVYAGRMFFSESIPQHLRRPSRRK